MLMHLYTIVACEYTVNITMLARHGFKFQSHVRVCIHENCEHVRISCQSMQINPLIIFQCDATKRTTNMRRTYAMRTAKMPPSLNASDIIKCIHKWMRIGICYAFAYVVGYRCSKKIWDPSICLHPKRRMAYKRC